jgi:glycosyltransferase involved in cell wall biosynthesis
LKIAVWHNLPSGGGKRALYYFVRGLTDRGHQLACWSLDTADRSYLPLSDFAPERIISADFNGRSRQSLTDKWRPDFNKTVDRMRAFDQACRRCAHEIEAGDFDVLFANSALQYYVPYIMRHVRMKKVLYLQEPHRYLYEARPVLPWVAHAPEDLEQVDLFRPGRFIADYPFLQTLRLQARQEWLNITSCDQVLVNSYFSRESVLRAYGVDARVCYLGVDTSLFRNLELPRERFIVGLGSFASIKGVDLAVRAVALLPEPSPPLVWIANSEFEAYRHATVELAHSLGVELRIQMSISDAELVAILNKATLLLYTSRLEPFGFAPLEANACGLPVVGIAEGGIRETVQDGINGFLVDPEASCIARAASQLLQNPSLAREMGKRARVHVEQNWNAESSIDRLEKILLRVVSSEACQED